MMGWCLYELMYLFTVFCVSGIWGIFLLYNVIRWRVTEIKKIVALHFVSMVLVCAGYLLSEFFIDRFDSYNCDDSEGIAGNAMVFVSLIIITISVLHRKKQYIVNRSVNNILVVLGTFTLGGIFLVIITQGLDDFSELVLLFLSVLSFGLF